MDKAENDLLKNYADPSASSDNTLLDLHKGFRSQKLSNYYGDKITGGRFDLYLIVLFLFSFLLIFGQLTRVFTQIIGNYVIALGRGVGQIFVYFTK